MILNNKIKFVKSIGLILILLFGSLFTLKAQIGTTYYIDSTTGKDGAAGTSPSSAWQTIAKVNGTTFKPGDSILFKCGEVWSGVTLQPKGSGSSGHPIVVSKYGTGNLPLIKANTASSHPTNAVSLTNQEYFTISNLEITNNYQESSTSTANKIGVLVTASNIGVVHSITLKDLEIHDVLGSYYSNVNTGGIFCSITGSSTPTWFDSLLIDHCHVYNVDRTGISNQSSWGGSRTIKSNSGWYPSTHLIVQNCEVDSSGANSMIIRVAQTPMIQYNKVYKSSIRYSGNSIFVFNCNDAIIQHNEGSFNVFNSGDADASAFDGDYRCHRTVIQYNYSHDNDGGAWVIVSDPSFSGTFDDSCIIRYNISQNDCHSNSSHEQSIVRIDGNITNTFVYNNTIYSSTDMVNLVNHCAWGGSPTGVMPDNTQYYNNLFYINKNNPVFGMNSSTGNVFSNNAYYIPPTKGTANPPIDANAVTSDPLLVNPGGAGSGINSVGGYKLQKGSPLIKAGVLVNNHSPVDYWGNKVSLTTGSTPCIGAFEFSSTVPVTLVDFRGEVSGNTNKLTWITTEEINNTGFMVQHSIDGETYTNLYEVPSKSPSGNTFGEEYYNYIDLKPTAGTNYYRLKQTDKDGNNVMSPVVRLKNIILKESSIEIYPNPVKKGNSFSVMLLNVPKGEYELTMLDLNGRVVYKLPIIHNGNETTMAINPGFIVNGIYSLNLSNSKFSSTTKLLVN